MQKKAFNGDIFQQSYWPTTRKKEYNCILENVNLFRTDILDEKIAGTFGIFFLSGNGQIPDFFYICSK